MRPKTLLLTLAVAALLVPTASAATTQTASEGPTEWYCGSPSDNLLYDECVLVATVVTAVCTYVTGDPRKCPE